MKNHIITFVYSDPAHEAYLKSVSEKLFEEAAQLGKYHGQDNLPISEEEYRARIHHKIEATIQEGLHYNQSVFQPVSGMVLANTIRSDAKKQTAELDAEIRELEPALSTLEKAQERGHPNPKRKWEICLLNGTLMIISLAEGVFAYEALRQGGFTTWSAILPAAAIGAGIYFLTHATAREIREGTRGWKRILRITGGIALVTCALFAVSSLRADGLNGQISLNPADVLEVGGAAISRWLLFFVSCFIYMSALVATVMHGKTTAEKQAEKEFETLEAQAQKLRQQIKEKQQKRDQIAQEAAEQSATALAKFEYALSCEERLLSLAKKAQVTYGEKNLHYRNDGLTPSFFVSPLSFKFKRFFDTTTSTKNNEN